MGMLEVQLRVWVTPKELGGALRSVPPHGTYILTLHVPALSCIHLVIHNYIYRKRKLCLAGTLSTLLCEHVCAILGPQHWDKGINVTILKYSFCICSRNGKESTHYTTLVAV